MQPGTANATIKNKSVQKENDFSSLMHHLHTVTGLALDSPSKSPSAARRKLHLPQRLPETMKTAHQFSSMGPPKEACGSLLYARGSPIPLLDFVSLALEFNNSL